MLNLARYDFLFAVVVGFSGLTLLVMYARKRRLPYPPGPKRLPVVGNLFSMPSQEEWVTYKKWSEELGVKLVVFTLSLLIGFRQALTLSMPM